MERIEQSRLDQLLPHREPIRVVAGVEVLDSKHWRCSLSDLPCQWMGIEDSMAVPGYWVIEWMAQAAALGSAFMAERTQPSAGRLVLIRSLSLAAFSLTVDKRAFIRVERMQGEGSGLLIFRAWLENSAVDVQAEAEFGIWIEGE
jgi:predicted hotdog family 3-hydroxylacyl-ACP dehydratase